MELTSSVAFWLALLVTVFGVAEGFYKLIKEKSIEITWWRVLFYGVAILILIGIILYDYYQKRQLYAGKAYSDKYLSVKIPSMFRGPFYKSEPYDLQIELANNTDDMILLSTIQASFYNPKVSEKVKVLQISKKDSFYTSIFEHPGFLLPKSSKNFTLRGPHFIPKEIEIFVSHSASDEKTKCKFIVARDKDVEPLSPKQLDFLPKALGIDGLDAVKKGFEFATQWSNNVKLFSCMPGSHKTYLLENGLQRHQIDEWILVFKNNLEQGIVVAVKETGTQLMAYISDASDYPKFKDLIEVKRINVGTTEALRLINSHKLIYGNSHIGWGLFAAMDGDGKIIPIWRSPYIGSDYLNLFINAENGVILPSKEYYDYCRFPTGSVTRMKKDTKEDNESNIVDPKNRTIW